MFHKTDTWETWQLRKYIRELEAKVDAADKLVAAWSTKYYPELQYQLEQYNKLRLRGGGE